MYSIPSKKALVAGVFLLGRAYGEIKKMQNQFKLYPGRHVAEFLGVEEQEYDYGPCLLWKFRITHGGFSTIVTWITNSEPTPGTACGFLLSRLLGRAVSDLDRLYIDTRIGDSYSVRVKYYKGYPRVESIGPASSLA